MKRSLSLDGGKMDCGSFENRAKRTFETERKRVTGGWRKLHKEGVHNLYFFAFYFSN
jgi:hypothetical protein